MKKNIVALLIASSLLPSISQAVELKKGTQEFGLQGSLDFDYVDDYLFVINTSYGYFIYDDWELGGVLDGSMSENNKSFNIGVFTEYNFTNESNWVPYLGAAAQLATLSFEGGDFDGIDLDSEDITALNIKLAGGIKYFINPHVAISAEVNYNIATDDISVTRDGLEDSFTRFFFGTRFYF
ncbi:outer membrane beta-barrel protein [Photobacterium rosenbergii]|uniref:Outer membrane beta-barrel protein n=1 Tax=Photobacterium rosenbergii TaxID=294936 RepID=A0ABU3ZEQ9_9GAMM|nr:outer membrane beta-barrel protein [Photobacterium rosenbergii]MDV5168580.1 outer membrane beta-barrel protein [Photobacterium rosenbergii]